ncbi:hypothetical protein HanPSC8_Chr08g0334601 [Helianthus annuus]|nr:hypothetical protein HanPSC8_Chr08g0334601 [Helianthus annuus]
MMLAWETPNRADEESHTRWIEGVDQSFQHVPRPGSEEPGIVLGLLKN